MIPTRSQIESYTTDHLVDAAEYWGSLADRWEDAHWQVRNEAHSLNWEGSAGDAVRARTVADYTVAAHRADQLRTAAGIARQQAGELSGYATGFSMQSRTQKTLVSLSGKTCRSTTSAQREIPLSSSLGSHRLKLLPPTFVSVR